MDSNRRLARVSFRPLLRSSFLESFLGLSLVVLFLFVSTFRHEIPPAPDDVYRITSRTLLYAEFASTTDFRLESQLAGCRVSRGTTGALVGVFQVGSGYSA